MEDFGFQVFCGWRHK